MNRGKVPLKAAFYAALLTAMVLSAMQLYVPKASAGVCCTYGTDCVDHTICCKPQPPMAPCSQNQSYYCMTACPPPGE